MAWLVPTGLYERLPDLLIERYGDVSDGITVQPPDDARFKQMLMDLQNV